MHLLSDSEQEGDPRYWVRLSIMDEIGRTTTIHSVDVVLAWRLGIMYQSWGKCIAGRSTTIIADEPIGY